MNPEIEQLIREVIEHPTQEGGWKLTENPNDPDGGWTYAGCTASMYNKSAFRCNRSAHPIVTQALIAQWLTTDIDKRSLDADILNVYYNEFYLPAVAVVRNLLGDETLELEGYELSCVVNVGLPHFEQIANEAHSDEGKFHEGHFCYHWMMYYIRLVQKNAEAWREYAKHLEAPLTRNAVAEPHTLRAEFLAGWFNRVEHWRGTE